MAGRDSENKGNRVPGSNAQAQPSQLHGNSTDTGNLHLSDIIATIQDEGPARRDPPLFTDPRKPAAARPGTPESKPGPEQENKPAGPQSIALAKQQTTSGPRTSASTSLSIFPEMPRSLVWPLFALVLALVIWNVFSLQQVQDKLTKAEADIETIRTTHSQKTGDLEASRKMLDDVDKRLSKLESEPAPAQPAIPDALSDLSDIKQAVADLTRRLTDINRETPAKTRTANTHDDWYINVAVLSSNTTSQQLKSKILDLGAEATIQPFRSEGKKLYRIRVYGFADQQSAEQEAQRLQEALKLEGLWVTR